MAYEIALDGGFLISDDPARLDLDAVFAFISEQSYWGKGRPRDVFDRSVRHSIALGLYDRAMRQCGFARVVTDRATRAHLQDVYVLDTCRGHGLGKSLVKAALSHPELASVPTWSLNTDDAQAFYARLGFGPLLRPDTAMMRVVSDAAAKTT